MYRLSVNIEKKKPNTIHKKSVKEMKTKKKYNAYTYLELDSSIAAD